MIIIDTELARREAESRPIRIGVVGGGYMARCIALQLVTSVVGMRLVAVANRTVSKAELALTEAGATDIRRVSTSP